jgi:uncharacterized Zn ribbon protein
VSWALGGLRNIRLTGSKDEIEYRAEKVKKNVVLRTEFLKKA